MAGRPRPLRRRVRRLPGRGLRTRAHDRRELIEPLETAWLARGGSQWIAGSLVLAGHAVFRLGDLVAARNFFDHAILAFGHLESDYVRIEIAEAMTLRAILLDHAGDPAGAVRACDDAIA